jgi:hypothetical protein
MSVATFAQKDEIKSHEKALKRRGKEAAAILQGAESLDFGCVRL